VERRGCRGRRQADEGFDNGEPRSGGRQPGSDDVDGDGGDDEMRRAEAEVRVRVRE